jgi:hypothetical protein
MSYNKALKEADKVERKERLRSAGSIKSKNNKRVKPDGVKEELIKKLKDGTRICIVDGSKVRTDFDIDFTEGGHDKVYRFIPKKTIWIDDDLKKEERPYILLHELHERRRMENDKWKYNKAHIESSKIEYKARHDPKQLKGLLKAEGWEEDLKSLSEIIKMGNQDQIIDQLSNEIISALFEGGPGSGNWGHTGRPGVVGGSQATKAGSIMKHLAVSQRGGITSGLFRAARLSATARALASGDPIKVGRRALNILIGRKAVSHVYLKGKRGKKSGLKSWLGWES